MIALEQTLGEVRVVGQARLPHQRRVGREAGDPRVGREREDPVEVGAVGEDLGSDPIEHRYHDTGPVGPLVGSDRPHVRAGSPSARSRLTASAMSGASKSPAGAPARLCTLAGCSISTVWHPDATAGGDVGVGVADHPRGGQVDLQLARSVEQHPRIRLAAVTGPGQLAHHPSRMVQADAPGVEVRSFGREQLADSAPGSLRASTPMPAPWPQPAGW